MSSDKPNIVLVVMDTARAENFSCYGYERNTTPFLDELAENNVKYERTVSQANRTTISHASLFTGEYVSEHRYDSLDSFGELDVFQEELSENGYTTLGAVNVPYLSEEFGGDEMFDRFFYNIGKSFFSDLSLSRSEFHEAEGLEKYSKLLKTVISDRKFSKPFTALKRLFRKYLFLDDSGAEKTNEQVKEMLEDSDEPFFLFLNYLEPHGPYRAPFPYSHKFLDRKFRWLSLFDPLENGPQLYPEHNERPPESKMELWKALYDGEINYLDRKLEELHGWIKEEHPNTVFIFTSDHGEHFLEKDLKGHSTGVYDEVTHVPMIEEFPNSISETVDDPVELKDLHDHILEISQGSFNTLGSDYAFSEDIGDAQGSSERLKRLSSYTVSVQDKYHKLIWYATGDMELFSMPDEVEVEDKEIMGRLTERIQEIVGNPEEMNLISGDKKEVDEEDVKESLRELGYL